jgi:hypothetical protein
MNSLEAHTTQPPELLEEQAMLDPFIVLLMEAMETTELDLFMDLDSSDQFNLFITFFIFVIEA